MTFKNLLFTFLIFTMSQAYSATISQSELLCSDIGFKKGTESFGDCVIELVSRTTQNEKISNHFIKPSVRPVVDKAKKPITFVSTPLTTKDDCIKIEDINFIITYE